MVSDAPFCQFIPSLHKEYLCYQLCYFGMFTLYIEPDLIPSLKEMRQYILKGESVSIDRGQGGNMVYEAITRRFRHYAYSAGDLFLGIDIILTIQMAHTLCESIQGLTSESEIDHMQSHRSALKRHHKNSILQT
jgi:hypothetical protein